RAFDLCRELRRKGFDVQIVMSEAAEGIVTEEAMEFASGRKVISKLSGKIEHVKFFGKKGKASLLLVAPATANTISKIAMGIDDTPVTTFATVAIGSGKPVLLAPAMHAPMYAHPIVVANLDRLRKHGVKVIAPLEKEGKAKLQNIGEIVFEVEKALHPQKLKGKKILVASGAFQSKIDDVRVITNNSSGKMGSALAVECALNGAVVKQIGNGVHEEFIHFEETKDADELEEKVLAELRNGYDYFFCPAALPDFDVQRSKGKLDSKKAFELKLEPRKKFLNKVMEKFSSLKIIAFKAEYGKGKKELESAAKKMLAEKKLFAVVATDISKNPVGADESEMLFCGKKSFWVKGAKKEIAGKIVENFT
ncbi:MAG: bifunctional phosphopantothenoylcysteine decarboxylase/phosphopantothenate--cysteine ligase CoaBC, partial [archaeon]